MRQTEIRVLFDYNYLANTRILHAAARVTPEQFIAPTILTIRNLRGTLVHALDVEWSWRARCQRQPEAVWQAELSEDEFQTVADLAERWRADEREMRIWLDSLSDDDLAADFDLGRGEIVPLWYILFHLVNHGTQQRSDAATLLTHYGQSPGDLDFLDVLPLER